MNKRPNTAWFKPTLIVLWALIVLVCLVSLAIPQFDSRETIDHTGVVTGVIPASQRNIKHAPSWYFICFQDGAEFYVMGKPEVLMGTTITITFTPFRNTGWKVYKVQ